MKWISTPVLFLLLCSTLPSNAQSDSARYADYQGTYLISTPTFPVNDVKVYWQDSTLAFKAGGSRGFFRHTEGDNFSFTNEDHDGAVTFKRNERGKVSGIVIMMDGGTYLGTKKFAGKHNK